MSISCVIFLTPLKGVAAHKPPVPIALRNAD